ncbi:uncharacterized protein JCM6883_005482 [Sporobolomyces salmoneus]|uniref:uncharacterized protein n=1 Tax=Sporobolomyces salmoneus TaxID=183962 RepID=UPI00316BC947
MSSVSKADLTGYKYHLDYYDSRQPDSVSPPPPPHRTNNRFPSSLIHPRVHRPFYMAQTYAGGDGVVESSLAALQANDSTLVSPLPVGPTPSSSSHPSRPNSPRSTASPAIYHSFYPSEPIPQPHAPSRANSTETPFLPSHTPELDLDHGSRASSIPHSKTIKVVQWTPQRGQEGTQVTIILDSAVVKFPQPSALSHSEPNFGPESDVQNPINRGFSVQFGQATALTEFTRAQAIDGNGVGDSMNAGPNEEDAFVVLTTFAPARNLMGPIGEPILVIVRVLDEAGSSIESSIIGNWDASPVPPPSPARVQNPKRSGDALVSDRDGPGIDSPSHSQHGSPSRSGLEWAAPPPPPQIGIPAIETSEKESTPAAPAAPPNPGGQPELVRTSQISAPKSTTAASFSNKVVLKLQGDLNTMAMGWSNEEWQNRRRLIQFWPQQDGNIVNVAFRPVAQNDWQPNSITISCIFRDDWNECFVSSVDTIYLLEALVGSRFSVEEKNRIRRNLEGFKPLTVSKSKPDAEAFFKLIMGFPQPKPRNIEKDVKVFPWKILSNALRKIMSKYSANYPLSTDSASTSTPFNQANTGGGGSAEGVSNAGEGSNHLAAPVSPRPSNSPASPVSQNHQSPHIVQSPTLPTSSTPSHFSHNTTPLLTQSPQLGHSAAFAPRSPQVQSLPHSPVIPHSPHRLSNLVPPPASNYNNRSSYDSYDSRDYSGMYANDSRAGAGHHQQHLFPSAEDYGVQSQQNQHLAPMHSNMNHYRSYSEGMPRTTHDGQSAIYSSAPPSLNQPFQPYDHSPHTFYSQSPQPSWIPPTNSNGEGGGGGAIADGNQA